MDYYTAPSPHHNQAKINALDNKLQELQAEYDALTAEDVEWTQEGETRCIMLEEEIESLERQIENMFWELP